MREGALFLEDAGLEAFLFPAFSSMPSFVSGLISITVSTFTFAETFFGTAFAGAATAGGFFCQNQQMFVYLALGNMMSISFKLSDLTLLAAAAACAFARS